MNDTKKELGLLAELAPEAQSQAFLDQFQNGYNRIVLLNRTTGKIRAHKFTAESNTEGLDAYYPLNTIRKGFSRVKALKSDITMLRGWGADLDPHEENEVAPKKNIFRRYRMGALLGSMDTKLLRQQAFLLQEIIHPIMKGQRGAVPSLLIFSGRGFQLIWYANKEYPVKNEKSIKTWEGIGRSIIATIGGDSVFNIDRILRLPGITNTKTGLKARVLDQSGQVYSPKQIISIFGPIPDIAVSNSSTGVDSAEFKHINWKRIYAIREILDLDDALIQRFYRSMDRDPDLKELYAGHQLSSQSDNSGSGFDYTLVGKLKRHGYSAQDTFEITMSYPHGSGHKKATRKDARYFMRNWDRSAGEGFSTPEEDFADLPVEEVQLLSTSRSPKNAHAQIVKDYMYVATANKVIHRETGTYFERTGFDTKFICTHTGRKDELPLAHKVLIAANRQIDMVSWMPGRERSFTDNGMNYFNMYRPNPKPLATYTEGCTNIFHKVMDFVIPNVLHREILLDHFAFTIQHPDIKINWHPLLFSVTEGVGKDTVFEAVRCAVGNHNTSETTLDKLTGNFNATLKYKKVIIINEMMSFEKGKEISNTLKPLLAAPPNTIEINPKYEPQFQQPNLFSMYMTSNSRRPLHLSSVDRRILPIHCREEMMSEAMGIAIWDWFREKGGRDLIHYELLHRDVSKFNPARRPNNKELMADHLEMQELSKSHSEVLLQEMIDNLDGVFARDIVLRQQLIDFADSKRMPVTTVEESLRNMGAIQISRASIKVEDKVRRYTMWVVRNHESYLFMKGLYKHQKRANVSYRELYDIATGIRDFDHTSNGSAEDIL